MRELAELLLEAPPVRPEEVVLVEAGVAVERTLVRVGAKARVEHVDMPVGARAALRGRLACADALPFVPRTTHIHQWHIEIRE